MNLRIIKTGNEGSELVPERISIVTTDNPAYTIHWSWTTHAIPSEVWEWLDGLARGAFGWEHTLETLVPVLARVDTLEESVAVIEAYMAAQRWHTTLVASPVWLDSSLLDDILDAAREAVVKQATDYGLLS